MSGSPGTGKTLLARAIAGEAGVPFLQVPGPGCGLVKVISHRIHGKWYIYLHENHKKQPNVGKYTIHGSYGI